jgi:hypothetical protein
MMKSINMLSLLWYCFFSHLASAVAVNSSEAVIATVPAQTVYWVRPETHNFAAPYLWKELHVSVLNATAHAEIRAAQGSYYVSLQAAALVKPLVYMSLTTMSSRVNNIDRVVLSYLHGLVLPSRIYLFISDHSNLVDEGIPIERLPVRLLALAADKLVTIVYTQNIGPHRKLLPLLKRYEKKDIIIATVDDDWYPQTQNPILYLLLIKYKETQGKSVVALRARRIGLCRNASGNTTKYQEWRVLRTPDVTEMLVVPTGMGGILYRPRFLHPVVFEPDLYHATRTTDDLMFRLTTMAKNISVSLGCRPYSDINEFERICPIDNATQQLMMPLVLANFYKRFPNGVMPGRFNITHKLLHNIYGRKFLQLLESTGKVTAGRRTGTHGQERDLMAVSTVADAARESQHGGDSAVNSTDLANETNSRSHSYTRRQRWFSLYRNNSKGGNDQQWAAAVGYLRDRGVMDISKVIHQYRNERSKECHDGFAGAEVSETCAFSDCHEGEPSVAGAVYV